MPTTPAAAAPNTETSLAEDYAKCEECYFHRHQNNTRACATCDGSSEFKEYIPPSN